MGISPGAAEAVSAWARGTWLSLQSLRSLRSLLFDVLVTAVLLLLSLFGSIGEATSTKYGPLPHVPWPAYLLVVGSALALIVRRRWPRTVLAVSTGFVLVYGGLGYVDGAALLPPMAALYTVAATLPLRTTLISAVVVTGLLEAVTSLRQPLGPLQGPDTVLPFEAVAVVAAGLAVLNRRAFVAALQERAERAERDREAEARRRVDAERLRIARELHDVIAHTMAVINVQAGAAAHLVPREPEQAVAALGAIKAASKDGLRELRTMLNVLRQADEGESTAPAPGLAQLDALVAGTVRAGLPTSVQVCGAPRSLPPGTDLAAYRIIQESLTNVVRHAGPATASVLLDYTAGELVIEVADTGQDTGTGPAAAAGPGQPAGAGLGIPGMRERAAAVGGEVEAGPDAGGGYRVRARLPLPSGGAVEP